MKFMTVLPTILKSMVYQANWNTRNMQGTGFAWLVKDLFRRNNKEVPADVVSDKPEYFNTNPYFITFILGVLLKESEQQKELLQYIRVYSSALAALGDIFFWHSLRPFVFFVSVAVISINPNLALIVYLLLYNTIHFGFRFLGFYLGYNLGRDLMLLFKRISFNRWARWLDGFSVFMLGVIISALINFNGGEITLMIKVAFAFGLGLLLSIFVSAPIGVVLLTILIGIFLKLGM